ncbi:unnamed protein product [Rotaria sp. Silwood2]|nr:unnamed protein product [Rotaria sp. Silwood2]CAF3236862.1 unnamed protein product [Rotaria sp. Silwood2]CAF3416932.1 unnamed protein product [Rotaria sp. Silwood2]CAF3527282.1 unnamed protein product [Rotaria sp. Silwood2]CAF4617430.1 unnamed protein product [Rotaria sp. Silwood2]
MNNVKTTYPFDTNQLSKDALSFTDERFYGFVKEALGKAAADLLQTQAINNVPSFLLSHDFCAVIELDIDSKEVDQLRTKISFLCRDSIYCVKAGIKNNFKYLKKLLLSKIEENGKIQPKPKKTTTTNLTSSTLTKDNHTEMIRNLIQRWTEDNKENFNFDELELISDIDYTLSKIDSNNVTEAAIRFTYGVKIKLRKKAEKFQIPNFYKHLSKIDVEDNNDSQTIAFSSATLQQSLSQISINATTSSSH